MGLVTKCWFDRFAGHDTTAVLLSMTFYALGGRPEIKKKILEEIEPLRSKGFVPSYDDLSSMQYIGMVLNESLRLYPPASSARYELFDPPKKYQFYFMRRNFINFISSD